MASTKAIPGGRITRRLKKTSSLRTSFRLRITGARNSAARLPLISLVDFPCDSKQGVFATTFRSCFLVPSFSIHSLTSFAFLNGGMRRTSEAYLASDSATAWACCRPSTAPSELSKYISRLPFLLIPPTTRTFQSLGMVRRLIGTVKDEETSLHSYRDPTEAQHSLERFRWTYNFERPHQALRYCVPARNCSARNPVRA
jgi:hypothetical protein